MFYDINPAHLREIAARNPTIQSRSRYQVFEVGLCNLYLFLHVLRYLQTHIGTILKTHQSTIHISNMRSIFIATTFAICVLAAPVPCYYYKGEAYCPSKRDDTAFTHGLEQVQPGIEADIIRS